MSDINTNKNIKNEFHSDYVKNWQNAMKVDPWTKNVIKE